MVDRLAGFFRHYTFSARTFYTGNLCDHEVFDAQAGSGHLHLLRRGKLRVTSSAHAPLLLDEPSLLFYPRPITHRFLIDCGESADLVCAAIDLGAGAGNPLAQALPAFLHLPFRNFPNIAGTVELLFSEAFDAHCGREGAIDRLTEYLLIQLLRHVMDDSRNPLGLLAGLADKRLAKALVAMHDDAAHPWTLASLATIAGMSRARFAAYFREVLGMTPGDYLSRWRIGLAQELIRRGRPINLIAAEVGYASSSAFSRAFRAQTGQAPTAWSGKTLSSRS